MVEGNAAGDRECDAGLLDVLLVEWDGGREWRDRCGRC